MLEIVSNFDNNLMSLLSFIIDYRVYSSGPITTYVQ